MREEEERALTREDSQGEVEVPQAGSEGAQDEAGGRQQAAQHDCRLAGQVVTDQAPEGRFKATVKRVKGRAWGHRDRHWWSSNPLQHRARPAPSRLGD